MLENDAYTAGLQVYMVGGAVRDQLLGLPAGDRDWVVVGANPEIMAGRGFIPVGSDFPVFLHPDTHEEYALARTERKSGHGYKGFTFYVAEDVTLEADLQRRDLTINAIAMDAAGNIIDPLGGVNDIQARLLRHTGVAFTEDPVRLLRLARFTARFADFNIAAETLSLCHQLVASGELDALVPERIWQEFAKGLMTDCPQRMLETLTACNALSRVVPGLVFNHAVAGYLACAVQRGLDLPQRFALLWAASTAPVLLRVPAVHREMAELLPKITNKLIKINHSGQLTDYMELFHLADALRRPQRCLDLLDAARCMVDTDSEDIWQKRLAAIRGIDSGSIARQAGSNPDVIRQNLYQARLQALADLHKKSSC